MVVTPKVGERFSEFYILGKEGKAANYPKELTVGEEAKVIVGIINHEQEKMTYKLEAVVDGQMTDELGPIVLEPNGEWEGEIGFTSQVVGGNQKVEFWLYKQGQSEISQKLQLWINVNQLR